jgi:tetratricopeptide (TPR) repeat protein
LLISFAWGWLVSAYQSAGQAARSIAVMELPESGRAFPATERPLPDSVRWLDLYAASDPVSNGPIFDDQPIDPVTLSGQSGRLESTKVHNRDSFLMDHTSYWQNSEEFVAEIVGALGAECGLKLSEILPMDEERLIVARHRRRNRVRWLRRSSRYIFASVIAVWAWGNTDEYAIALFDYLLDLVKAVPWLGTLLASVLPETAAATTSTVAITLALGTFAALGLVNFGWSFWDRSDRAVLVERRGYFERKSKGFHPALFFHFTWLIAVAFALGLVFEWMAWPWWAYLIGVSGLFLIAGGISGGADTFDYVGDINTSWPELLRRNGRWDEQAQEAWQRKMQAGTTALIDLAGTEDGSPVWLASLVFDRLDSTPSVPYKVFRSDSLFIAVAWCRTRSVRQLAATGDGDYLAADDLLLNQGKDQRVIQFWSRVVNFTSITGAQRAEALLNRAHRQSASGNIEEAFADYDAVIDIPEALAHDRASALFERGNLSHSAGDHEQAATDYSAVIDLQDAPANLIPHALSNRGACQQAMGDMEAAVADYTAVTRMSGIDPEQAASAYANRGWLAYLQGDNDAFYKDTAQAIEYTSQNLAIGFNMGLAALVTGELDEAAELYSKYAKSTEDPETLQAAISDIDAIEQNPEIAKKTSDVLNTLKMRLAELHDSSNPS